MKKLSVLAFFDKVMNTQLDVWLLVWHLLLIYFPSGKCFKLKRVKFKYLSQFLWWFLLQGSKTEKWKLIIRNIPFEVMSTTISYFSHMFLGCKSFLPQLYLKLIFCRQKSVRLKNFFHQLVLCGTYRLHRHLTHTLFAKAYMTLVKFI